jgi:hypothetical protein
MVTYKLHEDKEVSGGATFARLPVTDKERAQTDKQPSLLQILLSPLTLRGTKTGERLTALAQASKASKPASAAEPYLLPAFLDITFKAMAAQYMQAYQLAESAGVPFSLHSAEPVAEKPVKERLRMLTSGRSSSEDSDGESSLHDLSELDLVECLALPCANYTDAALRMLSSGVQRISSEYSQAAGYGPGVSWGLPKGCINQLLTGGCPRAETGRCNQSHDPTAIEELRKAIVDRLAMTTQQRIAAALQAKAKLQQAAGATSQRQSGNTAGSSNPFSGQRGQNPSLRVLDREDKTKSAVDVSQEPEGASSAGSGGADSEG